MTLPQESREQAQELYVVDGLTFEQVAAATGVAASTLKRWSDEGGWQEKKRALWEKLRQREAKRLELEMALVDKALETLDPQHVYAFDRLHKYSAKQQKGPEIAAPDIDRPKIFMEDLEFIAGTLKEADPEGLKVLARNFDLLVEQFKRQETGKGVPS